MLQKLKFTEKNPTAAAHGGRSIHTVVACSVIWGPRCRLAVGSYRCGPWQGPNVVAREGKTCWRLLPPWATTYVPDAVGHDGICIVLQNFGRTIYFCKIEIEKI
jgi:hypothetical protein